ncbi:MAG: 4-hydroxy-3-methylbut-2-enyl diphosphate reductase [Pseudomonadota bacterium]
MIEAKPPLRVLLAAPRGFCAGVSRAIETVEAALSAYGPPVFVRHQIVHNPHVVTRLEAMGAVFIEQVSEAPCDRPLVFSAHGSPKSAHEDAKSLGIKLIDAACPLVLKVHTQVKRFIANGYHVVVIGHKGHAEVTGVMGQAAPENFTLIETLTEAAALSLPDQPLAYVTQTTLSVDDTRAIINALRARFPDIVAPSREDICYATSNRQNAVKAIAPSADTFCVIGDETSSNSKRLVEVAEVSGARRAILIGDPEEIDLMAFSGDHTIGVTAGASSPEELVEKLLTRLAGQFSLDVETIETVREDVTFKLPGLQ